MRNILHGPHSASSKHLRRLTSAWRPPCSAHAAQTPGQTIMRSLYWNIHPAHPGAEPGRCSVSMHTACEPQTSEHCPANARQSLQRQQRIPQPRWLPAGDLHAPHAPQPRTQHRTRTCQGPRRAAPRRPGSAAGGPASKRMPCMVMRRLTIPGTPGAWRAGAGGMRACSAAQAAQAR